MKTLKPRCQMCVLLAILICCSCLAEPCEAASSQTLSDPDGFIYDVATGSGTNIVNGSSDAYDGAYFLRINGVNYNASDLTVSGRNITGTSQNLSGLTVSRKLYVPGTKVGALGNFGRWYDSLYNPTASTISVTVEYYSNLGSDGSTVITLTSDGDTTVETSDEWFATDDTSNGTGDPSLAHHIYVHGASESIDYITAPSDAITWRYNNVVIQPGQTKAFLAFAIQETNRGLSWEEAGGILNSLISRDINGVALTGLTLQECWNIVNIINLPPDVLLIQPGEDFIATGNEGGPFSPSSKAYTLTNSGPNTISWSAAESVPWLDVAPTSGILGPNDVNTVTVTLNANANVLTLGRYFGQLTFSNITSGIQQNRGIELIVESPDMIYWTDDGTNKIQRSDLNGGNVENLVTSGLSSPRGIAVDFLNFKMYWTDYGTDRIQRANLDGSNIEDLITTGLSGAWDIDLDIAAGKMYWADYTSNKIQRANLNGSNVEDLVSGLTDPSGIAVDAINGKVYWTDYGTDKIQRANLNGTNIENLVTGLSSPYDIALDILNGKMYWADYGTNKIQRANLDGSNIENIVTGLSGPLFLTLDLRRGKVYWTDYNANKIQRANLDGSNVEDIVTGLSDPAGIAIPQIVQADDLAVKPFSSFSSKGNEGGPFTPSSKTYTLTNSGPNTISWSAAESVPWLDVAPTSGILGPNDVNTVTVTLNANANVLTLGRYFGQLTFSNITNGVQQYRGVELIVESSDMIYWTDDGTNKIQRSDLNGGNIENLVTTGLSYPRGIAVDFLNSKMYWTDYGTDRIQRANLDGSNIEDLITTGLSGTLDIDLDVAAGKMYWADYTSNKIQRANLNGSNVEDLVSGLTDPSGIAVDAVNGKVYWTDYGTDKIQRANLNGTNIENLVTGLTTPRDIALDILNGKMYWTDYGTYKIQRANLDGSNIENIVTGLSGPLGITLDLRRGKVYWTDMSTNKIQRANLDGSNIEDIVTGLSDPVGITIPQIIQADDLEIVPFSSFNSEGDEGGPFTPSSQTYTLTNSGPNSIDWSVSITKSWINTAPSSGTLAANSSVQVVVSITNNAAFLDAGFYSGTVTFHNLISGVSQGRAVQLMVRKPGMIFYDDFPSTTIDGFNWIITLGVPTIDGVGFGEPSAPYSLRLNANPSGGDAVESRVINLSGQSSGSIELIYWWQRTGGGEHPDPGEDLVAAYWNGSSWTELQRHPGGGTDMTEYIESIIKLPSGALHTGFKLKFSCNGSSGANDDWFVDDVTIRKLDSLTVSPLEDFNSTGYEGGPFTPPFKAYTLTNSGHNPLDWSVTAAAPWLSIVPGSGTLDPNSSSVVVVSLNADANTLQPGDYNDVVSFRNVTSGFMLKRTVELKVKVIPGEIEVTDSILPVDDYNMPFGNVILGLKRTEQVSISNTDSIHNLVIGDLFLGGFAGITTDSNELLINLPELEDLQVGELSYFPDEWNVEKRPACSIVVNRGYKRLTASIDVLLLASGSRPTILQAALDAFPDINSVGYFNCSSAVPTFADLATYDVVVLMSSSTFNNAVQTGNVVADYVDAGGKVIQSVATFASGGGYELSGRFVTDGVYEPFAHGPPEGLAHSLGSFDSNHPIMDGVRILTDDLPVRVVLKPNAVWVANWNNGTPVVATQGDSVVGINIYTFDAGHFTGDFPLLYHNAIVWLLGRAGKGFTLENVPVLPAVILPQESLVIDVNFVPDEITEFETELVISSNDADEADVVLRLTGSGILDYLEVQPDADMEFSGHPGGPFIPSSTSYQLQNTGPIQVNWNITGPNWIDISSSSGSLNIGESVNIRVQPNAAAKLLQDGIYAEELVITNTTTSKTHIRNIAIQVHSDPKIWTNPYKFDVSVKQGNILNEFLTIGNSGDSDLHYELSSRSLSFTPSVDEIFDPNQNVELDENYIEELGIRDIGKSDGLSYFEDELLVRFAPNKKKIMPNEARRDEIIRQLTGGSHKKAFKIVPGLSVVKLNGKISVTEAVEKLKKSPDILYVQPNYKLYALETLPNDTSFINLWGMKNTGQSGGTVDADIDATDAWDIVTGNGKIVVAVIDTGVDYTHPDLAGNMWVNEIERNGSAGVDDDRNGFVDDIYGYDFVNNDGDPRDDHYHGTHCAGTIGAVGNNALGVTGVCWDVQIMAVKFLSSSGNGSDADAIQSIEYAMLMGARIMSNSWGGGSYSQALKDAIDAAERVGLIFVAAAGNDSSNNDSMPHYPSSYTSANIISVMATDRYDNRSSFSNYGQTSVDIAAPGSSIYSCSPGNSYRYLDGTSMATPHVAGACALMLSVNPNLKYQQVKDLLFKTADPTLPGMCVSGGRLNIAKAIPEVALSSWVSFDITDGTVGPGDINNVTVIFDGNQPQGVYTGEIVAASNDPYSPEFLIPVRMKVLPRDYLTERFEPNDPFDLNDPNINDMSFSQMAFRPDGTGDYLTPCNIAAQRFPQDSNGAVYIELADDDYYEVYLGGKTVQFYGNEYDTIYIGSNGYITFGTGDILYLGTLDEHFSLPRISALFDDLSPPQGGLVWYKFIDKGIAVTFENVPQYHMSNSNNFQIELYYNGKIRITWLEIDAGCGVAGLSEGLGLPRYFKNSNLSEYQICDYKYDLNKDIDIDFFDFGIFAQNWLDYIPGPADTAYWKFDEVSGQTAHDSSGNNHTAALEDEAIFVTGLKGNAVEFDGMDDRVFAGTFDVSNYYGFITISAWLKADDFDTPDAPIVIKTSSARAQDHIWLLGTAKRGGIRPHFCLRINGTTYDLVASKSELLPGVWTHLTASWDGVTMKLYINGVLVESGDVYGTRNTNNTEPVVIGNLPRNAAEPTEGFDGLIDDVRIYDRALSEIEIQRIYHHAFSNYSEVADFNQDCVINADDFGMLIKHWLE